MSALTDASKTVKSSATKNASRRTVRHLYDRREADVARELGVQARMLCGVWSWPNSVDSGGVTLREARSPGHCQRCRRSLERIVREWGAK